MKQYAPSAFDSPTLLTDEQIRDRARARLRGLSAWNGPAGARVRLAAELGLKQNRPPGRAVALRLLRRSCSPPRSITPRAAGRFFPAIPRTSSRCSAPTRTMPASRSRAPAASRRRRPTPSRSPPGGSAGRMPASDCAPVTRPRGPRRPSSPPACRCSCLDFDPRTDPDTGEVWTLERLKQETEAQLGCKLPESHGGADAERRRAPLPAGAGDGGRRSATAATCPIMSTSAASADT
jgi:hypothetical protein